MITITKIGNRTKITADKGIPIPQKDIAEARDRIAKAMKENLKEIRKRIKITGYIKMTN